MIGYIEGKLFKKNKEKILVLASQIGYEILIPGFVASTLDSKEPGDDLALYIYYHQTERQPVPVLIGFNSESEKEFFQYFISVEAIGPLKAVKALEMPIGDIAGAIETNDIKTLKKMKGIGERTAQKIVASLAGKTGKFAFTEETVKKYKKYDDIKKDDITEPVMNVLTAQLGHKPAEAREMIAKALSRNSSIETPGELFDEIYRGDDGN